MTTLARYKSHYPHLSAAQVKLLHAARIAAHYGQWSLSRIRTVGLEPLLVQAIPSASHLDVAEALLDSSRSHPERYCKDVLHYPRSTPDAILLKPMPHMQAPDVPALAGIELQGPEWALCKQVGYHSDTTDCDHQAYVFWCIKSTHPMTLMLGGNAYPMHAGQLVVFDARVPHALLSSSPQATMVAMIASAELTPLLRDKLGIAWRRPGAVSLDTLRMMDRMEVHSETGAFSLPGV